MSMRVLSSRVLLMRHQLFRLFLGVTLTLGLPAAHAALSPSDMIAGSTLTETCRRESGTLLTGTVQRLSSFIVVGKGTVRLTLAEATGTRTLIVYNALDAVGIQPMAHYQLERMLLWAAANGAPVVVCMGSDQSSLLGLELVSEFR